MPSTSRSGHRKLALSALAAAPLLAAQVAAGQFNPHLIKDLDDTNNLSNVHNIANNIVAIGNTIYFRSSGGNGIGTELFKSDGTPEGTTLIADLRTGTPNGFPQNLYVFNDRVFFNGTTGTTQPGATGAEVWSTDGNTLTQLKDINPGTGSSNPFGFSRSGSTLYFVATSPTHLDELWKTDGTPEGTVMVKDIHPAVGNTNFGSNPTGITPLANGKVIFTADDLFTPNSPGSTVGTFDRELWVSDGTAEGTVRVKDINPGFRGSSPTQYRPMNGGSFAIFSAFTADNGTELWRTDGTEAGTHLVKDLTPGSANTGIQQLTVINNVGYFYGNGSSAVSQLYRTDGTEAGTTLLKTINPTGSAAPSGFTLVPNTDRIVFSANDGVHGTELWVTNGTEDGTSLLLDLVDGAGSSTPLRFTTVADLVAFVTIAPIEGISNRVNSSLWVTDGTAEGTLLVATTPSPVNGYAYDSLFAVGNTLYFEAPISFDPATNQMTNYELHAVVIPEPAALTLALPAAALLTRRRRRA